MITIKDVARKTGVPAPTVARILRGGNKEVWPGAAERAKRVRLAAERMAYRPNASARAVRTGRFGGVALLLSTVRNRSVLFGGLLDGIQDALAEGDLHLTIATLPDEKLVSGGFVPKILREWSADGLLVNYFQEFPRRMKLLIARHRIPAVWTNCRLRSDCAYPDDRRAAMSATEELVRLGHRRIAYLRMARAPGGHYSIRDREKGYLQAMREAGLKAEVATLGSFWGVGEDPRVKECRALLARPDRPTAVVCYEMASAGPLAHAAGQLGLGLPRDLSVVTFHPDLVTDHGIPLRVMRVPMRQVGYAGARALIEKIGKPARSLPARKVPYEKSDGPVAPPAGPRQRSRQRGGRS